MIDPETCSRCLVEYEWSDLNHVEETGENICSQCESEEEEERNLSDIDHFDYLESLRD